MKRIKKKDDKPNKTIGFEIFSDKELAEMMETDKLPKKLADKAMGLWSDL